MTTALDLRLTTLEFYGLLAALRHYTRDVRDKSAWQLTERELILMRYIKTITPARVTMWEARRLRETKGNKSLLERPRYSYKADWLLVKVLYGLLEEPMPTECLPLLARLHQILMNAESYAHNDTGFTGGIVDTAHIIL